MIIALRFSRPIIRAEGVNCRNINMHAYKRPEPVKPPRASADGMPGSLLPDRRNGAYLARNWKFESISLQQTVRLSRQVPRRGQKARLFAQVCGPWQAAASRETGTGRRCDAIGGNISAGPNFSTAVPVDVVQGGRRSCRPAM